MTLSSTRRVVITGMGLVSPLGSSPADIWDSLESGRSGVESLQSISAEYLPTRCGGEARSFTGCIEDFGPLERDQSRAIRKGIKVMCREIQMGVAAAQLALADAGLRPGLYDPNRTGVVYGSDYIMTVPDEFIDGVRNCLDEQRRFQFNRWGHDGLPKVTPLWLLKYLPNMPASHIAIYNDLRGPNNSLTLREASANAAIAEAYCTIARGSADTIVVGATGTRIHPLRTVHVALQEELACNGEHPAKLCRPFDLHRTGMVLGEGAGAIVLEEFSTAQARQAPILAEVVGFGSSIVMSKGGVGDAQSAIRNVLLQSLQSARLSVDDVGHVHAHGLATRQCDIDEAKGIEDVFGHRRDPVPVTAAKSYFGNLGAGSGMIELIASVLALKHSRLFPVLNYETPDPDCPIHVVGSRDVSPGQSFINVNVTPQGQASAVVVRTAADLATTV